MGQQPGIHPYDFRRPDRLSKDQLNLLSGLFNAFCRHLAPELGGLLRTPVRLAVMGIDQSPYEDVMVKVPPMARIAVLQAADLGGWVVVVLPVKEAGILADLMLGGDGKMEGPLRPMGETEQLVLERLFALWPEHLRTAWSHVAKIDITLDRLEGGLEFVQLASPQETIVTAYVALEGLGDPIPFDVLMLHTGLQPYLARLHSATWSAGARQMPHRDRDLVERSVREAKLPVTVQIEGLPLGLSDLATISTGDVIPLGHPCSRPLVLSTGDREIALGQLGAVGNRLAIQIVGAPVSGAQEDMP